MSLQLINLIDLKIPRAGTPSGREDLPNFYVRSKNKKNITTLNYKQWIALWEKAKNKCIQGHCPWRRWR